MTHDWQAVDGGFVCAACGLKSLKGTSRGECKPRPSRPPVDRVEMPKPTPEEIARLESRQKLALSRKNCRHRGQQLTDIDGQPLTHKCGCPSSERIPINACEIHGACMRWVTTPPIGLKVQNCSKCNDAEPATADE